MKPSKISTITSVLLILNLAFLVTLTFSNVFKSSIKIKTVNAKKIDKMEERTDYKNENIVFLGDSITEWCPFGDLYEEYVPIVNSGRAGSRTFELLDKMEELVYQYNPTKVFILIGTNDLNTDCSKEELVKNIEKMIKGIQKNRSQCKIYVQSIYPVNKTDDSKINSEEENHRENSVIKEVNRNIEKLCKKYNVKYINMYDELTDEEGNLALKYTKDGLHISPLGYIKITKKLAQYVEEYP